MGSLYEFICTNCGYSATISGGDDCGMGSATTTILCEDCATLYNANTSNAPWDEESYHDPVCPKAKSHRIRRWKDPDICPKCEGEMERGNLTINWD